MPQTISPASSLYIADLGAIPHDVGQFFSEEAQFCIDDAEGIWTAEATISRLDDIWGPRVSKLVLARIGARPDGVPEYAGELLIDSGTLAIAADDDPGCHFDQALAALRSASPARVGDTIICSTGLGDGAYPVFIDYEGSRPAMITLQFLE